MLKGKRVSIIGGGNMGEVIASGVISSNLVSIETLVISDSAEERLIYLKKKYQVRTMRNNTEAAQYADIVILAVKPQNIEKVLEEITDSVDKTKLIVSIAAGISTKVIEGYLKKGIHVIRAMPNIPALISEGATALAAGDKATDDDLELVRQIFDSIGITVIVKEELMDAVTGLSGSGPAYVFIIIEALSDAGVKMGLTRNTALRLAAQTVVGAARLCLKGDKHPAQLKDMVTSAGGTTIAGVKALEDGRLRGTLMSAVEVATIRSKELGGSK
ncbi:MAG: pyrroline-5-carboxylate reductase [Syntrophobacterales bacterium]|nr:pyrroline-5-carboxylate reductase [Syntrophobacterales bacterium]